MAKKSSKKSGVGSPKSAALGTQSMGNKHTAVSNRHSARHQPTAFNNKSFLWVKIVVVIITVFISYILFPRLQFAPANANDYAGWYGVAMGGLMWWLWSKSFSKQVDVWKYVVAAGFLLVVFVSAVQQFNWMELGSVGVVVSFLVVPVGLMWLAILRQLWFDSAHQLLADTPAPSIRRRTEGYQLWFDSAHQPLDDTLAPLKRRRTLIFFTLTILVIGAMILFYRLGYYDFWEDEGLVINAAKGIQDEGLKFLQEGYSRAWMHTLLVTQSITLFGESEWSARLPSAIFGLIFIVLAVWVFYKWLRTPWVALLVPLLCLLTDEFVILFRYTRMYAPMIPFFLAGIYCMYRFLTSPVNEETKKVARRFYGFHIGYGVGALILLGIAVHLHPLAAIGFMGAFVLIAWLAIVSRLKVYWYILAIGGGIALVCFLLGYMDVDTFRIFPRAIKRILRPDHPEVAYYTFLFNNGLPMNAVIMALLASAGLVFNTTLDRKLKLTIAYMLALITMTLVFMVYLMADTGRDYRYIVHIVPLVMAVLVYVLYVSGVNFISRRYGVLVLLIPLLYTSLSFSREYSELYIKHPWSPRYTAAYADIKKRYQPGESILYQNMKTYYLDPESLAGDKAIKLGRRKEMTADQFKNTFLAQQAGWVVFDTHKSYHLDQEVIKFIIRHADKLHGSGVDDTGVEVFYFNNDPALRDE